MQPGKLGPILNTIANIVPERERREINMGHVRFQQAGLDRDCLSSPAQQDGAAPRAARPSTDAVRAVCPEREISRFDNRA